MDRGRRAAGHPLLDVRPAHEQDELIDYLDDAGELERTVRHVEAGGSLEKLASAASFADRGLAWGRLRL